MDEPSAILDDSEIETMFEVVRRLTAEGVGVIYISHRLDEIRRLGDRVTVLTEGTTVASGLPATTPDDQLVSSWSDGRSVSSIPSAGGGTATVVLEVRGVQRGPRRQARQLRAPRREVLGIGGLVGAGRSELLRAIYGVDRPRRRRGDGGRPTPAAGPARPCDRRGPGPGPEDRKSQALLLDWNLIKNVTPRRRRPVPAG